MGVRGAAAADVRGWGTRDGTSLREVLNAILHMLCTGCRWSMLPREFPPKSTVQSYFYQTLSNSR